jgi:hypothetical protein
VVVTGQKPEIAIKSGPTRKSVSRTASKPVHRCSMAACRQLTNTNTPQLAQECHFGETSIGHKLTPRRCQPCNET